MGLNFIRCAALYALIGMGFGIFMAAHQDFTLAPAHAHINLLGWVSMSIYGLYYSTIGDSQTGSILVKVQFLLANLGAILMGIGISVVMLGNMETGEPIAIAGSLCAITSALIFASRVFILKR